MSSRIGKKGQRAGECSSGSEKVAVEPEEVVVEPEEGVEKLEISSSPINFCP